MDGRKWVCDFFENVDEKRKRFLITLGLPVAGMKMETDGEMYYFGRDFAIDRENRLYYRGKVVSPRVWRNLAVLGSAPRGVRSLLLRTFGVERVKYTAYDELSIRCGRVFIDGVKYVEIGDFTDPWPGVHFRNGEYVFPRGAPWNMWVRIGHDVDLQFRVGDLTYALIRSRDYMDYTVALGVKEFDYVYYTPTTYDDGFYKEFRVLIEGLERDLDYGKLFRLIKGFVDGRLERKKNFLRVGHVRVYTRPFEFIVRDGNREVMGSSVEGWYYIDMNGDVLYRKSIGGLVMLYDSAINELIIKAVNGWKLSLNVPMEFLVEKIEKIIEMEAML